MSDDDHKYAITMSNGDCAEADSLAGALAAAYTMHHDADGESHPADVTINGYRTRWATIAARVHVLEADGLTAPQQV